MTASGMMSTMPQGLSALSNVQRWVLGGSVLLVVLGVGRCMAGNRPLRISRRTRIGPSWGSERSVMVPPCLSRSGGVPGRRRVRPGSGLGVELMAGGI